MKLTSPKFENGGKIPTKYTCDGENVLPPLEINGVPKNARSLVLIIDDPDLPLEIKQRFKIDIFDHLVLFNLPAETKIITESSLSRGISGSNSRGEKKYTGPCPPSQYQPKEHRYFFKLYALNKQLDLPEGATKLQVESAMGGHIISQAELMGKYQRI